MVHSRRALLMAAAVALSTVLAPNMHTVPLAQAAHQSAASAPAAMATRLNAYFAGQTRAHQFSGVVLLAQGNTVLLSKGYGMADWTNQVRNTSGTVFPVPFLPFELGAATILQLEDEGKLHEQDPICLDIPHCPAAWSRITLHEVLNGTSGIHDYVNDATNGDIRGQSLSLPQLIAHIGGEALDHKPGTNCCSGINASFPIEASIVEQVSGESFGAYLRQHILVPLGLTHTGYYLHTPSLTQYAMGYASWDVSADGSLADTDLSVFGGVLYSTVGDLYRWEQAIHTGGILSPASARRMVTMSFPFCPPGCDSGFTSEGVGDGVIAGTLHHRFVVGSSGGFSHFDYIAFDAYYPHENVTVIVLSNEVDMKASVTTVDAQIYAR